MPPTGQQGHPGAARWSPGAPPPWDPNRAKAAVFQHDARNAVNGVNAGQRIPAQWPNSYRSVLGVAHREPEGAGPTEAASGQGDENVLRIRSSDAVAPMPSLALPDSLPVPPPTTTARMQASGPISLHLDNEDIHKVLEMLSRQEKVSILVSPGVTGRVTANLQGESFDEALDALLKVCNLVSHRQRNTIFVYTPTELTQLEDRNRKLDTRIYHLNYVRAGDIQQMVQPFISDVGKVAVTPISDVGIGSDTGQVGGDSLAGGDVLIVQDYEDVLKTVDDIVSRVDVRPLQLVIEAVIMEAILEDGMQLGVNFAILDNAGRAVTVLGNGAILNSAAGFSPAGVVTAAAGLINETYADGQSPPLNGDEMIQSGGALRKGYGGNDNGLKFGLTSNNVTGFVRALKQFGDVNVLASPCVMVLNKQRAELIVGEKLGFLTMTATETAAVQNFEQEEVGTQLRLRPFVSADGMIRMEIHPERSTGTLVAGIPQTRTSEVTTNVMVQDGSTIVIGGLSDEQEVLVENGIPVLSRIPWIGALFRYKETTTVKRELIVMLTPRIWDPTQEGPGGELQGRLKRGESKLLK
ncbi:MAG: hypothetical protein HQ567_14640 [Candidatus Nealsonbacteria bacterium]|nr:hypothetical protein [Candidatus Nealsonbacteria bacterium]